MATSPDDTHAAAGAWETFDRRLQSPMTASILLADGLIALPSQDGLARLDFVQPRLDDAALQRLWQVLFIRRTQTGLTLGAGTSAPSADATRRWQTTQALLAAVESLLTARAQATPDSNTPSPEKQEAYIHWMEDFNAAMAGHSPASAAATLATMLLLHDRAADLRAGAPIDYLAGDLASAMVDALAAASDCALELGDAAQARDLLQQAVGEADRYDQPSQAAALRLKLATLLFNRAGSYDQALRELLPLRAALDGRGPSLERVQLTLLLAEAYVRIGDTFETARAVRDAEADLAALGCLAPDAAGLEPALATWILTADRLTTTPNEFRAALHGIVKAVMTIASLQQKIATSSVDQDAAVELVEALTAAAADLLARDQAIADRDNRLLLTLSPEPQPAPAGDNAGADYQLQFTALIERQEALRQRIEREGASEALLDEATALLEESRRLNAGRIAALLLTARGGLLHELGRDDEAARDWRAAWDRSLAAGEPGDALYAMEQLIDARLALGDFAAVSGLCGEAIDLVERDRYNVSPAYLQGAYLTNKVQFYFLGVFAAWKLGDIDLMLRRVELSKARAAVRSKRHAMAGEPRKLEEEIRQVTRHLETAPQAEQAGLRQRRRTLWDLLAIQQSDGQSAAAPEFSLPAVQAILAPDEVVVSYYWLQPGVLLVTAIDWQGSETVRQILDDIYPDLEALIERLGALPGPRPVETAIERFAGHLLPSAIHPLLAGKQRIVFSPHRLLHRFPLHALPWKGDVLIAGLAASYAPNLTSLLIARPPSAGGRVLAVGASQVAASGFNAPPLPGVTREIDELQAEYGRRGMATDVLTGKDASAETLRRWAEEDRLRGYRVIHIAAHGEDVLGDSPMETGLLLYDGEIDGLELSTWRLDADLVVMSACHAGKRAVAGRGMAELAGDDLFGLQGAFFSAGARAVIGALWKADDA
ncbi:MAG: CHAT domain-containing protein, partial [Caldilineales bacterium]